MSKNKAIVKTSSTLVWLLVFGHILIPFSCKPDRKAAQLDRVTIHENPFVKIASKPEVLLDHLNNPAAPFFVGGRIIFAESGKGTIFEYKEKKAVPLIEGFGLDNYDGYAISILGMTSDPATNSLIVAASQDVGHIFVFDESTFPTTVAKGREIELQRTEPSNPFGILLIKKGKILVASGGTKSVYQGPWDVINPDPLRPVFDVATGVEMMAEDTKTGLLYGAVVGTGKNDGYLIRWNLDAERIQPETLASGFTNLVGVVQMPNRLLLLLEFGSFGKSGTGRLSVIDPDNPGKVYPLLSGLDSPAGLALGSDNTLLISTFGEGNKNGMLLRLKLVEEKPARY
jgi:hypothetical protein